MFPRERLHVWHPQIRGFVDRCTEQVKLAGERVLRPMSLTRSEACAGLSQMSEEEMS